ncbi:hypothetical protein OS493_012689 [Desmophyllum pertusum]|uniref:B30.2/SPRY domain-containing protein n=1 Tax=Desmophyllum pertusum TaxID=174260 RepID=A0A9W9ZG49_9CNID|nr:hypothetical protein OS493_012689 [Desmophyllum pertusum]
MVKSSEFATRRKKDRKFKRLYEGPAREYALYSVPYSVNIISRVYGVNPAGEGTPSEELVLSTPKGVGIARKIIEDPILGEDSDSYAVQINEHPNASCSNTKNRVQIKRPSKELTHANIGVLLNLDEHFLNLYLNGKLLTDPSRPNGPTFVGLSGEFYPALSLYGTNVKLTVHTGESYDT